MESKPKRVKKQMSKVIYRNKILTKICMKKNSVKRTSMDTISQIENITGMQFKNALQMQLAVQRQLHEKLEIQRNLQLRIEEQAKQLKKMFDQQQKTNKSQNSEITSMNLEDDDILKSEVDSENTLFQSKI